MNELELKHYGVLGMKWGIRRSKEVQSMRKGKLKTSPHSGIQGLSDRPGSKKANSDSVKVSAANRLYPLQDRKTNSRVARMSTGKAVVQSLLMSSYGALKYNEARANGENRGEAIVKGVLAGMVDSSLLKVPGNLDYLDNRNARK